jgi:hypothetical protein
MLGVSQVIAISAISSSNTIYALRIDGTVFACGKNDLGEIGDNATLARSTFVQAIGISQIVAVGPGLVVAANGHVFGVGYNQNWTLPDGTQIDRSSFVRVY